MSLLDWAKRKSVSTNTEMCYTVGVMSTDLENFKKALEVPAMIDMLQSHFKFRRDQILICKTAMQEIACKSWVDSHIHVHVFNYTCV